MDYPGIFFLFYFLPALLAMYLALGFSRALRDAVLLFASLVFISWNDAAMLLVLLAGILANWVFGLLLQIPEGRPNKGSRAVAAAAVVFNISLLAAFKYATAYVNGPGGEIVFPVTSRHPLPEPVLSLFTLQALSYVLDVHARAARAETNPLRLGLYLAFFPPLLAGPVQRYTDFASQLRVRSMTFSGVAEGCPRLVAGMGKLALLVPPLAAAADRVFLLSATGNFAATVPALLAWTGIVMFALSLYFCLSGYADMAIGLGRMFGFSYRENFRHPYAALSVSDFWQRWNISLVGWFSRYLGLDITGRTGPDAGMRRSATARNLLLAWVVVGVWHWAGLSFVIWGMWNAVFLFFERILRVPGYRLPSVLGRVYALTVVCLGWVFYRADTTTDALIYLANMFAVNYNGLGSDLALALLRENWLPLLAAVLLCVPLPSPLEKERAEGHSRVRRDASGLARMALLLVVYVVSVVYLASSS